MPEVDSKHANVVDELRMFTEKGFQLAVGYLGGIAAIALTAQSGFAVEVSRALGIRTRVLLALTLAAGDAVYLTLATACIFAIVKRGLFLLKADIAAGSMARTEWELYLRSNPSGRKGLGGWLTFWNGDNVFFVPLFMTVLGLSLCALIFAWQNDARLVVHVVVILIGVAHLLPLWILASAGLVTADIRAAARRASR